MADKAQGQTPPPTPTPTAPPEPEEARVFQLQEVAGEPAAAPAAEEKNWQAEYERAEKRRRDTEAEYTRQQQRLSALDGRVAELTGALGAMQQGWGAQRETRQEDPWNGVGDDDFLTAGQVRQAVQSNAQVVADQVARTLDSKLGPMANMVMEMASEDVLSPVKGSPLETEVRQRYRERMATVPAEMKLNREAQQLVFESVVGSMRVAGADPLSHRSVSAGNDGQVPAGPDSSTARSAPRQTGGHDPLIFESDEDYTKAGKLAEARKEFGLGSGSLQRDWNKLKATG